MVWADQTGFNNNYIIALVGSAWGSTVALHHKDAFFTRRGAFSHHAPRRDFSNAVFCDIFGTLNSSTTKSCYI